MAGHRHSFIYWTNSQFMCEKCSKWTFTKEEADYYFRQTACLSDDDDVVIEMLGAVEAEMIMMAEDGPLDEEIGLHLHGNASYTVWADTIAPLGEAGLETGSTGIHVHDFEDAVLDPESGTIVSSDGTFSSWYNGMMSGQVMAPAPQFSSPSQKLLDEAWLNSSDPTVELFNKEK